MSKQLLVIGGRQGRQTQEGCIVSKFTEERGFSQRLRGWAAHARDSHQRFGFGPRGARHFFRRQFEHRLKQTEFWVPDGELGWMYSDGQSTGTRRCVVAE